MDIMKILEIIIIVVFMVALIVRGGEQKKIVSKKKIDECIGLLNTRLKKPRSDYRLNAILYEQLKANIYDEKVLRKIAVDIIGHCGIKKPFVNVIVEGEVKGVGGTYSNYYGQSTITIMMGKYKSANEILAVMVHECMHMYLNTVGIRYDDREMNEYLTDVATVYMGFYDIVTSGYFHQGYLTTNNLKYVRKCIRNI